MKNWTKLISVMVVVAVIMSMGTVALAVGIPAMEEMTLTGLSNISVTQATNRYFEERNAYLLGETNVMDWPVVGIVNDEAAHKAQYGQKNIVLSDISYTVDTVACFDTYAEVSVSETVSYIKNGVTAQETVMHMVTIYLDTSNIPLVVADEYRELFSSFVSCSYVEETAQTQSATTTAGGGPLCIVEIAKGELGTTETGTNMTKYGAWYGMNGEEWCAMFVSWCADQANVSTSIIAKTCSCGDMRTAFRNQGRLYYSPANNGTYTPVVGDILFVGTTSTGPTHVGIVALVENGKVWIYDGNWQNKVSYHCYSLTASNVLAYGHPAYESTEHAYGDHVCDDDFHWQVCTVCGLSSDKLGHLPSSTYEYNVSIHWNPCAACGIKMNEAAHVRVDLGNGQYKCRFCDCRIFPEFDLDKIEIDIIGG